MSQKIKAIVLKSNERKEKDLNVLLFSLEKGKIWATLKGVKNQNAKMKLAQNQFCFGEFVLEEGKSGQIVTGFECLESFHEICEDLDKFFEGSAILETLDKLRFSSDSERAQVFVLTLNALKNICFSNIQPVYVLDKFLLQLFKIFGTPLYTEKCSCCGTKAFNRLFLDDFGQLVCVSCKTPQSEEVSKTVYLAMKILLGTDFEKLCTVKLAKNSEILLLKLLVKNFERTFDENLKFIGILS